MSADASGQFELVKETGWRRGLGNLLRGEYSTWFKSSRWWKHILVWFAIINVMMGIMVVASAEAAKEGNDGPPVLFMYGIFGGMFVAFGVMIIMQRVLVRENQSGTAAWVLSKPVTRTAFIVSRLVVNSIAILLTSVIVPGVFLYLFPGCWLDRQPKMRAHPRSHNLWRKGICCFRRDQNGLYSSRGGCAKQCAEVTRVADLIGDEQKIWRVGHW